MKTIKHIQIIYRILEKADTVLSHDYGNSQLTLDLPVTAEGAPLGWLEIVKSYSDKGPYSQYYFNLREILSVRIEYEETNEETNE